MNVTAQNVPDVCPERVHSLERLVAAVLVSHCWSPVAMPRTIGDLIAWTWRSVGKMEADGWRLEPETTDDRIRALILREREKRHGR